MSGSMRRVNPQLLMSLGIATVLLLTLFALCLQFGSGTDGERHAVPINLVVYIAGWATGWVAGTLVAPYDQNEATLFSRISKGIWAFASGYLLGKIDPLFSSLRPETFLPFSELATFRILLFVSVATIVMLVVFFARKYGQWHVAANVQRPDLAGPAMPGALLPEAAPAATVLSDSGAVPGQGG